jgi:hypothetical protein
LLYIRHYSTRICHCAARIHPPYHLVYRRIIPLSHQRLGGGGRWPIGGAKPWPGWHRGGMPMEGRCGQRWRRLGELLHWRRCVGVRRHPRLKQCSVSKRASGEIGVGPGSAGAEGHRWRAHHASQKY